MSAVEFVDAGKHDGGVMVGDVQHGGHYVGQATDPHISDYHGFLNPHDTTAISFWIVSIAMVASTVFFLMEAQRVTKHWKTSLHVGALVTLVAGVHYFYMREFWITVHASPIVYRYIDWSITVPLQMIEFYLILEAASRSAGTKLGGGMFWRLMVGTVIMLAFGYLGEIQAINPWAGFVAGMCGWFYILFEIFSGEASKVNADSAPEAVQKSFANMRFIVSVGWSIYPLGYFFGYLMGAVNEAPLNVVYNLADFLNKICFCLAVWACAVEESDAN